MGLTRSVVRAALSVLVLLSQAMPASAQEPQPLAGATFTHVVTRGQTWRSIASRFGVDVALLTALNGTTSTRPLEAGESLRVDSRHLVPEHVGTGIVINVPQRMLFVKSDGAVVASYPVGLGRPSWPTFIGPFTITASEVDPVWDVPPSIQNELRRAGKKVLTRVLPGPTNPLGKYWLGLSEANYGIHGTTAPQSIYRFESHGCIRLHPDDIADLWTRAGVGTAGEIVYEPVLLAVAQDGAILLEAHRDVYRRGGGTEDDIRQRAGTLAIEAFIDWDAARATLAAREGTPRIVGALPRAHADGGWHWRHGDADAGRVRTRERDAT